MKKFSIALIIVLFASSVQMFGMTRALKNANENPNLTQPQANRLWDSMDDAENLVIRASKMLAEARTNQERAGIQSLIDRNKKREQACHDILFDKYMRQYTDKEIASRLQ